MQFVRGPNVSSDTEGFRERRGAEGGKGRGFPVRKLLKNEREIEAEGWPMMKTVGAAGSGRNTRRAQPPSLSLCLSYTCG